jgi:uncharacterized protein (TIGR02448 family)
MRALIAIFFLILAGLQQAQASGSSRSLVSTGSLFSSSYLTSADHKLVQAAQDDAGSFIASNGEIRGPYLEAAIMQIRTENPGLEYSDMELAHAILAKNALAE